MQPWIPWRLVGPFLTLSPAWLWLCCLKAKQANSTFSGIIFRHVLPSVPPPAALLAASTPGPGASPGSVISQRQWPVLQLRG